MQGNYSRLLTSVVHVFQKGRVLPWRPRQQGSYSQTVLLTTDLAICCCRGELQAASDEKLFANACVNRTQWRPCSVPPRFVPRLGEFGAWLEMYVQRMAVVFPSSGKALLPKEV